MTAPIPSPPAPGSSRPKAWLLVLSLLLLPFVVAGSLYGLGWRPPNSQPHGQWQAAVVPLPLHGWRVPAGETALAERIAGYWTLVQVVDGPCPAACQSQLDSLRRIQVSLNRDMRRIRRVALVTSEQPAAIVDELLAFRRQQPDLIVATASGSGLDPGLHLLDPQARPVLFFTVNAPASEIRADLARLLKLTWNG